jgi:hypothetical protein
MYCMDYIPLTEINGTRYFFDYSSLFRSFFPFNTKEIDIYTERYTRHYRAERHRQSFSQFHHTDNLSKTVKFTFSMIFFLYFYIKKKKSRFIYEKKKNHLS